MNADLKDAKKRLLGNSTGGQMMIGQRSSNYSLINRYMTHGTIGPVALKAITVALCVLAALTSSGLAVCIEHDSYSKQWTLSARAKEASREERQKYYASLSPEQRLQVSDFELYPTASMSCGRGFWGGLAKVMVDGRSGFIDKTGRLVIKATLNDAGAFSDGLAPFEASDGKWGYINATGNVMIAPRFHWALSFREGRALVQVGEKWGFIDTAGRIVVEPRFDHAESFSEGLALVQLYLLGDLPGHPEPTMRYKTGFVDNRGNWVIQPKWDGGDSFNGGMAQVSRNVAYKNGVVSETVYIDKAGRELWVLDSWYRAGFSDDLLVVGSSKDRFTFVDRKGKQVTARTFRQLSSYSEGLAPAVLDQGYGYVDRNGEFLIKPKFDFAMPFAEGFAAVESQKKFGYIDKSGDFAIEPRFDWAWAFQEGFALVALKNKTAYIDRTGKYIWNPTE